MSFIKAFNIKGFRYGFDTIENTQWTVANNSAITNLI